MLSIDIRHPDVEKFINIKKDLSKVTGANISVMVRDDFMEAVKADKDYILRWPCTFENTEWIDGLTRENGVGFDETKHPKIYNTLIPLYDTSEENKGIICYAKRIKAKEVWNQIIEAAHGSAEPGIIFIDKHWNYSPDSVYPEYKGITTNP